MLVEAEGSSHLPAPALIDHVSETSVTGPPLSLRILASSGGLLCLPLPQSFWFSHCFNGIVTPSTVSSPCGRCMETVDAD